MTGKAEHWQARDTVAAYHEARLGELVAHVADAIDSFRREDLDAFDLDRVLLQYSRAARELWKFCNLGNIEITARQVTDQPPIDWWQQGAPRQR